MFMRRRFQPSFDGLCSRIAPSAVVAAPLLSLPAGNGAAVSVQAPVLTALDAESPDTGTSHPNVLPPMPKGPPSTLLC